MSHQVYKVIEITGASTSSIEDAINKAIEQSAKSVREMRWFEVIETRGDIRDGKVAHWQVTVKIGFAIES